MCLTKNGIEVLIFSWGYPGSSGFPCSSVGKESAYHTGDLSSVLWSGRSPGEGNSNPVQYSCLENPMDRGAWQAIVHGVTRVGHGLATKPPPPPFSSTFIYSSLITSLFLPQDLWTHSSFCLECILISTWLASYKWDFSSSIISENPSLMTI